MSAVVPSGPTADRQVPLADRLVSREVTLPGWAWSALTDHAIVTRASEDEYLLRALMARLAGSESGERTAVARLVRRREAFEVGNYDLSM